MTDRDYDVVVVGAGPAGLAAAAYRRPETSAAVLPTRLKACQGRSLWRPASVASGALPLSPQPPWPQPEGKACRRAKALARACAQGQQRARRRRTARA